jgi:DUF2911 family protein
MKKFILLLSLISSFSFAADAQKSPRMQADGEIYETKIMIDYGAPSVRERIIWGDLVPYDKLWRAGANENTTISFDKDVTIGGEHLAAGKYGFFIIPSKEGDWVVIFNKRNADWGANKYDEKEDALRLNITPDWRKKDQEQLTYYLSENLIVFAWANVKLEIPLKPNKM